MNKEEISVKAVKAYNTIMGMFNDYLGDLHDKEFVVKFFIDSGAGIHPNSYIYNKYKAFGISEHSITFSPSDPGSLENAIASMITYLYAFPNTFAVIKQGTIKNFLFADIHNIHTPEYVSESDHSSTIGGSFMLSGEVLTREEYDNYNADYSGNFNDRDIRYLLGFDNEDIVGLMLSKFQTLFREQIDENIEITDLRI